MNPYGGRVKERVMVTFYVTKQVVARHYQDCPWEGEVSRIVYLAKSVSGCRGMFSRWLLVSPTYETRHHKPGFLPSIKTDQIYMRFPFVKHGESGG